MIAAFEHDVFEMDMQQQQYEFRLVRPTDQRTVWVCGRVLPMWILRLGLVRSFLSALTDISTRKQLEADRLTALAPGRTRGASSRSRGR